jgi:hypothetical protein
MVKKFVVLAALALTACATPQDRDFNARLAQRDLPAGCTLYYPDEVGAADQRSSRPSRTFYIDCSSAIRVRIL